jgi:hypothetical protein
MARTDIKDLMQRAVDQLGLGKAFSILTLSLVSLPVAL